MLERWSKAGTTRYLEGAPDHSFFVPLFGAVFIGLFLLVASSETFQQATIWELIFNCFASRIANIRIWDFHLFEIWGSWDLRILVKTHSVSNRGIPGRGLFFPRITRPWNFRPHLGDFLIFLNQKRRRISPNPGTQSMSP